MKFLALLAIRFYQRFISPHKGYCCAYRAHTGYASCSALGFRAIRRFGVLRGISILRSRFHLCGVAHRRFSSPKLPLRQAQFHGQAGFCDAGCDAPCDGDSLDCCDGSSTKGSSSGIFKNCDFCSGVSVCDGCNFGSSSNSKKADNDTHIPRKEKQKREKSRPKNQTGRSKPADAEFDNESQFR